MRRRDFIKGVAGSATAWPLAARAQQSDRKPRIGVLMAFDENDTAGKTFLSAFRQGLSELGWSDGGNIQLEDRWCGGDVDRMAMFAKEVVKLQADVILTATTPVTAAAQRETRTIPIVFVIRSVKVSLPTCRVRAAISPALLPPIRVASGWSC